MHRRGRVLLDGEGTVDELLARHEAGWRFHGTAVAGKLKGAGKGAALPDGTMPIAVLKPDGRLHFFSSESRPSADPGDQLITYGPTQT